MLAKTLPPPGKKHFCFQKDGKSTLAEQCYKSLVLTKVIDTIIDIDSFEKECVIIKGLLHP